MILYGSRINNGSAAIIPRSYSSLLRCGLVVVTMIQFEENFDLNMNIERSDHDEIGREVLSENHAESRPICFFIAP